MVVTSPLSYTVRGTVTMEARLTWTDPAARLGFVSTVDVNCSGRLVDRPPGTAGPVAPCTIIERATDEGGNTLRMRMVVFSEQFRTRELHVIGDPGRATAFALEAEWVQTVDCD